MADLEDPDPDSDLDQLGTQPKKLIKELLDKSYTWQIDRVHSWCLTNSYVTEQESTTAASVEEEVKDEIMLNETIWSDVRRRKMTWDDVKWCKILWIEIE